MFMASSPSINEFPVFIDTNLGTHFAMSVSPDITSGDLKGKLGREHYLCFPNIGEISVRALMVKCKSCFYHIPDSVPIKSLFQGLRMAWFLQLDVSHSQHVHGQEAPLADTVVTDETSPGNHKACASKWNANDSAKLQNEQSSCLVDQPEELPMSMHDPRRKGRFNKKCNSKDVIGGSHKDAKMRMHASLGGYSNAESLLSDNSFKELVSKKTQKGKVDSNDFKNCRSSIFGKEFEKKANSCRDIQSRYKIAFTEENYEIKDGHSYNHLEKNATDLNVDWHKLIHLENSFSHITQKGQGTCSPQTRIDCLSSLKEAAGREDMSSPSESDIISVTGILTRYFDSDEVDSQAKGRRTTTECSEQTNDSELQKLEDSYHRFYASDVEDCNSQTAATRKKIRKQKILPFNRTGEAGLHLKGSHGSEDEHPVNQVHLDESIKAKSTPQAATKCPSMQFSVQWSFSPITETPKSKLKRSEVGKRILLAANNGLGISTSKQKPQTKYCSRATKLSFPSSIGPRRSVFEISDRV